MLIAKLAINPMAIGISDLWSFPIFVMVSMSRVIQLPHSKIPQKPAIAPGTNVSGFYTFATITVSMNMKDKRQKGTGMNLLD